jgi:hypothetical protein
VVDDDEEPVLDAEAIILCLMRNGATGLAGVHITMLSEIENMAVEANDGHSLGESGRRRMSRCVRRRTTTITNLEGYCSTNVKCSTIRTREGYVLGIV